MSDLQISIEYIPRREEILDLYSAVGWIAYTDDPDRLVTAIAAW